MPEPRPSGAAGHTRRSALQSTEISAEESAALEALEARIGPPHVRQRLGIERDYEVHRLNPRQKFTHNAMRWTISACLWAAGLHGRAMRNARAIEVRHHDVPIPHLPEAFDGFTILQLSDLHSDLAPGLIEALIKAVEPLRYDLCVMTGDYRAHTYGPFEAALEDLKQLRACLKGDIYAILGNHNSIRMVLPMEEMGYRLLLNELVRIDRDGETLYLAGIEDAHLFRLENYERAAADIPPHAASILLSHTPETYRHAAHAGFDLMLCGHTHGGQICLPGGVPLKTEASSPRALARGSWRHDGMVGYTSTGSGASLIDVRLNCPPEVTLHRLRRGAAESTG